MTNTHRIGKKQGRGTALANNKSVSRYSTMDNVDGKQARRTGTSSPLGELFEYVIKQKTL
jgi:hypothetical protein